MQICDVPVAASPLSLLSSLILGTFRSEEDDDYEHEFSL